MSKAKYNAATSRPCRPAPRRRPRRGAVTLLAIWMLMIFLVIAAWVLNYNFLVLVNRNMQQKADAVALAAAVALLDEDVLRDPPRHDQSDDLAEAKAVAEQYRRRNNQVQAKAFCVNACEMVVGSGYVADISSGSPFRFESSIPLDDPDFPHNTLRIAFGRPAAGNHPVRYILDFSSPARAANVSGAAYATLDNLVVGMRPSATVSSPVMPMAVDADKWAARQPPSPTDSNGNGIGEMVLQLRMPNPPPQGSYDFDANAVLLDFSAAAGLFDDSKLLEQIAYGVFSDQVAGGTIGPITGGDTGQPPPDGDRTVTYLGRQFAAVGPGSLTARLVTEINNAVSAAELRGTVLKRVFLLCRPLVDWSPVADAPVELIALVGCNVLGAAEDVMSGRLQVIVEPTFIIHRTAWTVAPDYNAPAVPRRNTYIHKLRLSH